MSTSAGVSVQKRLSDQRARLLALDYHDPFTAESLALVERLFEDLVTTTESYEDLQQREDQTAADLALSRAQLFPLKKENARLLRDNNLLAVLLAPGEKNRGRARGEQVLGSAERSQDLGAGSAGRPASDQLGRSARRRCRDPGRPCWRTHWESYGEEA
ncbi:unnamed protein product [Ectocarpus sp. 8 AP-2014]